MHIPWHCPTDRLPLDDDLGLEDGISYPRVGGIPVLLEEPHRFLARHLTGASPTQAADPLPVDAPDPLTPHLSPSALAELAPPPLALLLRNLPYDPTQLCAQWGQEHAPEGMAVDAGCGVGAMARLMATQGRAVAAFDRSPRAVLLARDLLAGSVTDVPVPEGRASLTRVQWPFPAVQGVGFAVADATAPPLPPRSAAWVHAGNLLDMAEAGPFAVLDALAALLQPGGLLTLCTPWDEDRTPLLDGGDPALELLDWLDELDLEVVASEDLVPWAVRQYDRGWRLLFCQCLALQFRTL